MQTGSPGFTLILMFLTRSSWPDPTSVVTLQVLLVDLDCLYDGDISDSHLSICFRRIPLIFTIRSVYNIELRHVLRMVLGHTRYPTLLPVRSLVFFSWKTTVLFAWDLLVSCYCAQPSRILEHWVVKMYALDNHCVSCSFVLQWSAR